MSDKFEKFRRVMLAYLDERLVNGFAETPDIALSAFESWADDTIALRLVQDIYGRQCDKLTYRHPRDGWQALKQQYAPEWVKRRWSVRETEIEVDVKLLYPKGLGTEPVVNVVMYRDGCELWQGDGN